MFIGGLGAIAMAGGQTDLANVGSTVLVRRSGINRAVARRFNPIKFASGKQVSSDLFLQDYDIIYVPPHFMGKIAIFLETLLSRLPLLLRARREGEDDAVLGGPAQLADGGRLRGMGVFHDRIKGLIHDGADRDKNRVRLARHQRFKERRIIIGAVFEVGILHEDQVAGRSRETAAQCCSLTLVHGMTD